MVFAWLSPIIVIFLVRVIPVLLTLVYSPFAIFIVPSVFTVPVALLIDCLAYNQL